jgi:hypothetical protein
MQSIRVQAPEYRRIDQKGNTMDITIYLPDDIGQRAKAEDLKLSRMLRGAVEKELAKRDAMAAALSDDIQTYEVDVRLADEETGQIRPFVGRITGQRLYSDTAEIYLTADKRVLAYFEQEIYRLDDPPEDLRRKLKEWVGEDSPTTFVGLCEILGLDPVIDL